jgi:acetolactate decarboxylase
MLRLVRRALAFGFLAAATFPASAEEAYQISTISSLLAGGYDGNTTMAEMLSHGGFGLGTFNGVDGEMMVLDGKVYRGTTDGHAHLVAKSELTPCRPRRSRSASRYPGGSPRWRVATID